MKISDVFKSELLPSHIRVKSTPIKSSMDDSVAAHEFICEAVNNHDKLTEELQAKTDFLNLKLAECDKLTERVKELEECLSEMICDYQCTASICSQEGYSNDYDKIAPNAKQLLEKGMSYENGSVG